MSNSSPSVDFDRRGYAAFAPLCIAFLNQHAREFDAALMTFAH
ncbi:hypothetical protein FBY10_12187 [Pseudomonas sp. SJZ103]|nr:MULTISPECIES: hypothetical protein [unclassified Pseudomonas]TWC61405.1 hypothetical protein FBY10_12187 [Pseudomonas sp. SJZ103]TWC78701.1 hypothetical protein FBY08_12287 [Pseudomonas sp. SJZ094]